MPILGIMASQISGHLWQPEGAYDSLATVTVPSGGVASITFAGIPTGYKHLQIRSLVTQGTGGSSGSDTFTTANFNGDTGSNYMSHAILGDGSSASATATATSSTAIWFGIATTSTTSSFAANVIDILDYASISKNKTVRGLLGNDRNGAGTVVLQSALWMNSTTAINSILISASGGTFKEYSSFALYGVK